MFKSLFKKVRKSKGGFTLIELIAVIAILGILAVILIPTIGGQLAKAKTNAANTTANSVYTAIQLYQADEDCAQLTGTSYTLDTIPDSVWNSKYFQTIKKTSLSACTISLGSDGAVLSVSITDKNGNVGNYPKS